MRPTSRREFLSFWRQTPANRSQPAPTLATTSTPPPVVTSSSEPLRLPPLQQTVLDVATTDALFRDLAACTTVQAVIPKYARNAHTGPETLSLEQARTRLAAGLLLGVQIRYAYDGHAWTDTLLRRPAGLTLVRIREADIVATIEPAT